MTDVVSLPLYVEIEEGLDEMKGHKKSKSYITSMMNTYVKNTPFKQMQIVDLHQKIQQHIPDEVDYSSSTISRQLRRFRKEGLIVVFDEHDEDLPRDRLFVWASSVPSFVEHSEKKEQEKKERDKKDFTSLEARDLQAPSKIGVEDPHKDPTRPRKRNPATPFFKAVFQKILGST